MYNEDGSVVMWNVTTDPSSLYHMVCGGCVQNDECCLDKLYMINQCPSCRSLRSPHVSSRPLCEFEAKTRRRGRLWQISLRAHGWYEKTRGVDDIGSWSFDGIVCVAQSSSQGYWVRNWVAI